MPLRTILALPLRRVSTTVQAIVPATGARRLSSMSEQLVQSGNGVAPAQPASTPTPSTPSTKEPLGAGNDDADGGGEGAHTLATLPKSWRFTSQLPPDPLFPTPADSHKTPRDQITPRQVRGGLFTWVRPQPQADPELLAVSPAALRDLNIKPSEATTEQFRQWAAGNVLLGWDEDRLAGGYPWAQLYGGFQFGQWAGQLGDGRAISLFETTTPAPSALATDPWAEAAETRYEVQLKGAGLTPYSRFADGKAVLRSSIREFVVSEALNALGIPTTRALALTLLPHSKVRRETFEPGAIVVRFAQSWVRLGNFDILRARGDRASIRKLATYVAEEVLGGWDRLPARLSNPEKPAEAPDLQRPPKGVVGKDEVQGPAEAAENRFARMYREVVRRNALTVARWQAYGFMNGVLNTDNTSIYGLSIDFGPFAFMDNFDPAYTPNHDDHMLRYSYRNQPTIIWWNLVRLGEALGELLGAGATVDTDRFVADGVSEGPEADELVARAEKLIVQAGEEYKAVFLAEYKRLMTARLGLRRFQDTDFQDLFSGLLDTMEALELDFHHTFRRLSHLRVADLATEELRKEAAGVLFHKEGISAAGVSDAEARERTAKWLDQWQARVVEDWGVQGEDGKRVLEPAREEERMTTMKKVNPSFIPRSFVLDEVIQRVEKGGERDVLRRVMHMALHPFEEQWDGEKFDRTVYKGDREEELRWTGDVPRFQRAMQCSCSS
jgi:serine/tyrosine/threonine adenylyltransferase